MTPDHRDPGPVLAVVGALARTRGRWLRALLAALALFLASSAPAWGASKRDQAKAAVEQAERQYKLGRFDAALEDYARAYELFAAPALLFNLGQCHKQLKNYERAIFFFEGYLRDEPRPANRRLAQELISESQAELAKQERATAAAATAAPAVPLATATADPAVAAPAPALAIAEPAPPQASLVTPAPAAQLPEDAHRSSHAWWLWSAIAAGVVVLGAIAYYETGASRTAAPEGTLGTIDRR